MKTLIKRALVAGAAIAATVAVPSVTGAAERPEQSACTSYRASNQYPLRLCDKGPAVRVAQALLTQPTAIAV